MDKPFTTTFKFREQQGRADRKNARPEIVTFERALVQALRRQGMPFFCHNMWRDDEWQDRLFAQGVSNSRAGQSPHNHGMAADIVHSKYAWELHRLSWDLVGHIGYEVAKRLQIAIQWGGDWKDPWDPAHWEMKDWRTMV